MAFLYIWENSTSAKSAVHSIGQLNFLLPLLKHREAKKVFYFKSYVSSSFWEHRQFINKSKCFFFCFSKYKVNVIVEVMNIIRLCSTLWWQKSQWGHKINKKKDAETQDVLCSMCSFHYCPQQSLVLDLLSQLQQVRPYWAHTPRSPGIISTKTQQGGRKLGLNRNGLEPEVEQNASEE